MTSQFDRDTAVSARAPGRYIAHIDDRYWVQSGPNGGLLSAIALRAARAEVPEPERTPRSLHVRFLSAPAQGEVELSVDVLRAGRTMTSLAVTLRQGGKARLTASACFSEPFSDIAFQDCAPPELRPLDGAEPVDKKIPLNHRYDMWRALGGELRQGDRALSGGYIRFAAAEPHVPDVYAMAAMWDAWPPAAFARAIEQRFRGAAPTVEASIYFRAALPRLGLGAGDYLSLRVEATLASEGFVEESGEIWSPDGTLLMQSRQLVLLF